MRYIFIVTLLLSLNQVLAQDNDDDTVKPSWSEDMPELHDAPDMDLDTDVDTDIGFEMEDLDRRDLFNDSDDEDFETDIQDLEIDDNLSINTEDVNQASTDQLAKEQAEADQLAKEQAAAIQLAKEQAEAVQLAKAQAEAIQLVKEQAAAEQLAKEQAVADQLATEQAAADQLAKEQTAAIQLTNEQAAADQPEADQPEADQLEADQLEADQLEADQLAKEQALAFQLAKEQAAADQLSQIQADEKSANEQIESQQSATQSDQNITVYQWEKVKNVLPKYPLRAARSHEEGWVEVELEINPNGDVVAADARSSFRNSRTFNNAAVEAAKQWKFDPPINSGINENQFRTYKILFKL